VLLEPIKLTRDVTVAEKDTISCGGTEKSFLG